MNKPPEEPDGAVVYSHKKASKSFGVAGTHDGRDEDVMDLVVATCSDVPGYCLSACNSEWVVVGDLYRKTAEDALLDAERYHDERPTHRIIERQ